MRARKYLTYYSGAQELRNIQLRKEVKKYCSANATSALIVEINPYKRNSYIVSFKSQFAEPVAVQYCNGLNHLLSYLKDCPFRSIPLFTSEKKI